MSADRIQKQILLRALRARVWQALSDSAEFGAWCGMKFDGPFAPGAVVRAEVVGTKVNAEVARAQKQHQGMAFEITIERMEPEQLFSFRWHPNAVERGCDYSAEPPTLVEFTLEETSREWRWSPGFVETGPCRSPGSLPGRTLRARPSPSTLA